MPQPLNDADWILLIGDTRAPVGISNRFVQKFKAWSKPFRLRMRDPVIERTRQIPLPQMTRFTSTHEYYINEGVYSSNAFHNYHLAPQKAEHGPFLAGRTPQHRCELALEEAAVDLMMREFGEMFDIEELKREALSKFERHIAPAWRDPEFPGLIVAADRMPSYAAQRVLRRVVRRALASGDFKREDFKDLKHNIRHKIRLLRRSGWSDWRDFEQSLTEFVVDVEYSSYGNRSRQDLLRGDPFD